jgi:hypothetical protein
MSYNDLDVKKAFWFWNRCSAVKYYPKRPIKKSKKHAPFIIKKCNKCGKEYKEYRVNHGKNFRMNPLCSKCVAERLEEEYYSDRIEAQRKANKLFAEFNHMLVNCEKNGTCDILSAHHELLINDNERLSTEFMIGLVCGTAKKKIYVEKREHRQNMFGEE